jgi:hypothetical protein
MKFNIVSKSLLVILPLIWVSCEEVIHLDLKNSESRTVIEATLNATTGECSVTTTKSSGFYENGELTKVERAIVELVDCSGVTTRFNEVRPGTYQASNLFVKPCEVVRLNVAVSEEEVYSAVTRVPRTVMLDSISFEQTIGDPRKGSSSEIFVINARWTDPGFSDNYYRFKTSTNGVLNKASFAITSNEFYWGAPIAMPILHYLFSLGDTVSLEFQSIDSVSFAYYDQLNDMQMPSFVSATPYNPIGNFDNGALGYFGIFFTEKKDLIVSVGR